MTRGEVGSSGASAAAASGSGSNRSSGNATQPASALDNNPPEGIAGLTATHARENTPLLSVRVADAGGQHGSGSSLLTPGGRSSHTPLDADGMPLPSPFTPQPAQFKLYAARWYVLLLFSLISLLNNAVCYTAASVHLVARRYYHGSDNDDESTYDLSTLVTTYFLTYCIFSFPSSWFVERWGLKAGVLVGAWLQVTGCFIRVLATPLIHAQVDGEPPIDDQPHGDLWLLLIGQVIASLGQGFFVNPPPLLAAVWFGVNERTLATTIACNANTLGIAVAFLVGPALVDSVDDLPEYMWACFVAALACAGCATFYFPRAPPTPPSHSQVEPPAFPSVHAGADGADEDVAVPQRNNVSFSFSGADSTSASPPEDILSSSPEIRQSQPEPSPSDNGSESSDEENPSALQVTVHDVDTGRLHALGHSHSQGYGATSHSGGAANADHGHSASAPLINGGASRGGGSSSRHHVRVQSASEMAVAQSFAAMSSPPCRFVRKEAILAERSREAQASRILASARMFRRMFLAPGFVHTLLVFSVAEAAINALAAFMFLILEPWGYRSMQMVGGMVCAFIGWCMVGSAVIGWIVDRSKAFKTWIVLSLVGSAAALLYLILAGPYGLAHIWISICLMGFLMGPVQPLSIETAVEVSYPAPESSVTAVQQVLGNLFSAALFPLLLLCRSPGTQSMQASLLLLLFCLLGVGVFYLTFDGEYRRLNHEREREQEHIRLHRRLHEEAHRAKVKAMQQRKAQQIAKLNAAAASSSNDADAFIAPPEPVASAVSARH